MSGIVCRQFVRYILTSMRKYLQWVRYHHDHNIYFNNNKGGKLPEVLTPLSLLSKNNLTSPLKPQLFMDKN